MTKVTIDSLKAERKEIEDNFRYNDKGIVNIVQPSPDSELAKQINEDEYDEKTKMSGIDLRSRLHYNEISGILALDTLVSFGYIEETNLNFTRKKKRLNVSLNGKGRQEHVEISTGRKEVEAKRGMFGWLNKKETA